MVPAPDPMADVSVPARALLVVAKRPAAGHTKTRLCPPLTGDMAAHLYTGFLLDTLEIMRQVPDVHRSIAYLPEDADGYFRDLAPDMALTRQQGDDARRTPRPSAQQRTCQWGAASDRHGQ